MEHQAEGARRAVAVIGHDDVSLARAVLFVVEVRAVHEEHHVGVLLDGAGIPQVTELGPWSLRPLVFSAARES